MVDSNQAQLFVPEGSLPEGVNAQFVTNEPNNTLKKVDGATGHTADALLSLQAEGENDGTATATLVNSGFRRTAFPG